MGFENLLGNERMKESLGASLARGHISHFYLISGPRGSGKQTLARLLCAAILCQGQDRPCGSCGPCRKIAAGLHPDVITVLDPEHKNVAVKIVRQIRDDVFIRPNESEFKIYIFPQELGTEGQNALLKILEEPPKHGIFILITDNSEKLLPTVRSRCTELKMLPLPRGILDQRLCREFPEASAEDLSAAAERSGGFLGQALEILREGDSIPPQSLEFVRSFAAKDPLGLTQVLAPMEKWKRDELVEILGSWQILLEQALAFRTGGISAGQLARTLAGSRSSAELLDALKKVQKAARYAQSNVSSGAVCGWLSWALR